MFAPGADGALDAFFDGFLKHARTAFERLAVDANVRELRRRRTAGVP